MIYKIFNGYQKFQRKQNPIYSWFTINFWPIRTLVVIIQILISALKIRRFRSHHCIIRPKNLFKITRVDYDHQPHSMQVKKQTKQNSVISILSFSSRYYPLEVIISRQETSAFSFFVLTSCSEIRPLFFPSCFTVGYHSIINTSSLKKKKKMSITQFKKSIT